MTGHEGKISQAIVLAKAGDLAQARQLLAQVLADDPESEMAWAWMGYCASTDEGKIYALENVLRINPLNKAVQRELEKVRGRGASQAPKGDGYDILRSASKERPKPQPQVRTPQPQVRTPQPQVRPEPAKAEKEKGRGCLAIIVIIIILAIIGALSGNNGDDGTGEPSDVEAWYICKKFVKDRLVSPSTAKFPAMREVTVKKGASTWEVRSHVDSQNRMGATIRATVYCELRYKGNGNWGLEDILILER